MRISMMVMPQATDSLDAVIAAIGQAADVGVARVWLPQPPPMAGVAAWDALTTLAIGSQHAPGVELATGVVVAYTQHPLGLARHALTVSAATGGRLVLGIGVSHRPMMQALGYSYEKPAAFLREYLQILVPALAGKAVDHHGRHLHAAGQVVAEGAVAPPVIVAAAGPLMLDLAGELADGTLTAWASPQALQRYVIPRIAEAAAGRPAPQIIASLPVAVTVSPDAARSEIAHRYAMVEHEPAYQAVLAKGGVGGVAEASIIGDEAEVLARVRDFADIGVTEFVAGPFGDPETRTRTMALLTSLTR
jgi:F420-dependent oxidoreductase-like protein